LLLCDLTHQFDLHASGNIDRRQPLVEFQMFRELAPLLCGALDFVLNLHVRNFEGFKERQAVFYQGSCDP
jgi:hypothetical protein